MGGPSSSWISKCSPPPAQYQAAGAATAATSLTLTQGIREDQRLPLLLLTTSKREALWPQEGQRLFVQQALS